MADRIIKGDSGNDVIIQNNDASRKIEVTNSGDVEVTGDLKATTVKATNLKANDGTAGLVIADSTGEVTSSGGLKATNIKTTNIKANDGTAGLVIADSTGRVTFSENNPVITLGTNATFPTKVTDRTYWYMGSKGSTDYTTYDYYRVPDAATGGGEITMTGCAPTGFTSIVSADYVIIENATGTGNAVSFAYQLGTTGASYATHAQGNVEISNTLSFTQYNLRFVSFLNVGSTHFEDVIAEGDMFGFRFTHGGGSSVYGLGAKITWRF